MRCRFEFPRNSSGEVILFPGGIEPELYVSKNNYYFLFPDLIYRPRKRRRKRRRARRRPRYLYNENWDKI
jgi:hypothetical protein